MKQKNIVATLYLKDGHAVRSMTDFTPVDANVYRLCQLYNDSGVDKIIIFDLSTSDDEHEKNINTIKNINRNIEIALQHNNQEWLNEAKLKKASILGKTGLYAEGVALLKSIDSKQLSKPVAGPEASP